ncbi:MAG: hypothetical protein GFGODING_00493 [Flavobacteriales bacterium]|nr:hypothetical protein [Flavobacteriales bacterium]
MTMTRPLLLATALLTACALHAQKVDPRHTNFYRVPAPVENEVIRIEFKDPVAQLAMCKVRVELTNKTSDILIIKASEIVFTVGGATYSPKDRDFVIRPNDRINRTLEITGGNMHHDAFSVKFGGANRLSRSEGALKVPDFDVPPSKNSFTAGNFEVNLVNMDKETAKTALKFKVVYRGSKVALVDPSRTALRIESGQEFANASSKSKEVILQQGEDDAFTVYGEIPGKIVDMQFANMKLVWNDAFREVTPKPFKIGTVDFTIDPGLTEGKNR